ncbi:MAG: ABC transporter substrate-binding protein [Lachnospiraceae bacterium]|nr:ABC transporter substrate-binding protein [Lachnospiraceae bacterium]
MAVTLLCFLLLTSCAAQGVPLSSGEKAEDAPSEESALSVEITLEGGSGKAWIESPVSVEKTEDGYLATFVWSSENYDYMIVDGVRYENGNPWGSSTFTVPVKSLDIPLSVIADTVAMSKPHEIEYTIHWKTEGNEESAETGKEASFAGTQSSAGSGQKPDPEGPSFSSLEKTGEMPLSYAKQFSVEEYGDYRLLQIGGYGAYLVVPEGAPVPSDLPENVTVLQKPFDKTYLVSTSVMDFIRALDCLPMVRLTGTKAEDWYIEEAREALENGTLLYAGKYRAPDYELLLREGCNLAIENTMIEHDPAVKEKLTELGIPVLIETSSYESHPLGRLEWIKVYGLLFDREQEAKDFYDAQLRLIEPVMEQPRTDVTVAFFSVTSGGQITVRKPGDYISEMIALSGGTYVAPAGTGDAAQMLSTVNVQLEDFYAAARDADILIYNSTIENELDTVDELIAKNALFADFQAVREKEVYCTGKDFFQQVTGMASFMEDLQTIFTGNGRTLSYLEKLH